MNILRISRFLATLGALAIWLIPVGAGAHGGPELVVEPTPVTAGDEISVKGAEVEAKEVFTIRLEGAAFEAELGHVTVGDEGDFQVVLTVPVDAPAGSYLVRAASEEGEEASIEISVVAAPSPVNGEEEQIDHAEPSAEPMSLDRPRLPDRSAVIVAGTILSIGLGLPLVRGGR